MTKIIPGVPDQKIGGSVEAISEKCFDNLSDAAENFAILKSRLLYINSWHSYGGSLSANFLLCDVKGEGVQRLPLVDDLVRIDIPGVGTVAGDGYDWVKIIKIDNQPYDADDRCLVTCMPTYNPKSNNLRDIAHFYTKDATSNVLVSRKGLCLTAEAYGRNEIANDKVGNIPDKVRNTMIALGGKLKLAKLQWKSLTDGLLNF